MHTLARLRPTTRIRSEGRVATCRNPGECEGNALYRITGFAAMSTLPPQLQTPRLNQTDPVPNFALQWIRATVHAGTGEVDILGIIGKNGGKWTPTAAGWKPTPRLRFSESGDGNCGAGEVEILGIIEKNRGNRSM